MDFDGDGRTDILSGSWPGEIYLFRRQSDGGFTASEILKNESGENIKVGSASAVFAADWDHDGDLDLLVGTIEGHVQLVDNTGTAEAPAFSEAVKLHADGMEIKVDHGDAGPAVADWDADGLPDLVVGCGNGAVVWYRNVGGQGAPELAAGKTLVPAGNSSFSSDAEQPQRGTRAKVCVTDFNGDGRLDLLVGDFAMESIPQKPLTEEQQQERDVVQERYQKIIEEYFALTTKIREKRDDDDSPFNPDSLDEATRKQYDELMSRMREVSTELQKYQTTKHEYHGYVWVFLRGEPVQVAGDG